MTSEEKEALTKQAEMMISMAESLERLEKNQDFLNVINNYLQKEPLELTFTLASANKEVRDSAKECLIGIARFGAYLHNIKIHKERGKKQLEDLEKEEVTE